MTRFIALATLVVLTASSSAQEIRRARVKKLDLDNKTITLTVAGKDDDFTLTEDTRVLDARGTSLKERMQGIKEGMEIQFRSAVRDGKSVVLALRAGAPGGKPPQPKVDTTKLKPLTTLGTDKYQGFEGGLYPGGKNDRPKEHEAAGLSRAKEVRPLDADGKPARDGKVVLLSVGMSNTTQEFSAFKRIADADGEKNPVLVIVDGAQGGMTAARIKDPESAGGGKQYWDVVDQRVKTAGVTREQVQVAWIKQADAGPREGFPKYAQTLRDELRQIVRLMHQRFPNLKLVYLSSRTYGGYARTPLNPEPYAFESGLSVKWLIEEQLKGDSELNFDPKKGAVKAPWLAWGPYLWANGTAKNPDGLAYEESDFGGDGTHPSDAGRRKVAHRLLEFFRTDSTAKSWFLRPMAGKK